MEIFFGLNKRYIPDLLSREAWDKGLLAPFDEMEGRFTYQCWVYQTWVFLKKAGLDCQLIDCLPKEGIFIALGQSTAPSYIPPKKVFFVDILADGPAHPAAHLHLVQNRVQAASLPNALFMPHWPQPHLIKRDATRGDRFENVVFFGNPYNLAEELREKFWYDRLQCELGLTFRFLDRSPRWHDYRDCDCALAIRDFSGLEHFHKPSSKLYNAWLAGVPFIGGTDSAYAADGQPGKNYLVARSAEEAFSHLKQLKENKALRASLVAEGEKSGAQFTQSATLQRWRELLEVTLPMLYPAAKQPQF